MILASDQGYAPAQYNLGGFYYSGEGVSKDLEKAKRWYKLVADQGDEMAKTNLENNSKEKKGFRVGYLIMAILFNLGIVIYIRLDSPYWEITRIYNYEYALSVVPFSYFGAIIGDKLRKALMSDMVFGNGFEGLLKAKIFGAIGPQFFWNGNSGNYSIHDCW